MGFCLFQLEGDHDLWWNHRIQVLFAFLDVVVDRVLEQRTCLCIQCNKWGDKHVRKLHFYKQLLDSKASSWPSVTSFILIINFQPQCLFFTHFFFFTSSIWRKNPHDSERSHSCMVDSNQPNRQDFIAVRIPVLPSSFGLLHGHSDFLKKTKKNTRCKHELTGAHSVESFCNISATWTHRGKTKSFSHAV